MKEALINVMTEATMVIMEKITSTDFLKEFSLSEKRVVLIIDVITIIKNIAV
ncbi:MAG: hypothetical protein OHK0032_16530 [Thermodesulfovibrionales bacterium]